ncbi:MAG TPA: ATP-binding cassette domain-containing protein [Halococcus sp.]|nr:ATP-binding cassette domain-containing protein [Halococcus sp.]
MTQIGLEHVEKRFNKGDDSVIAVEGVNLTIEDGEFLIMVGPSGSGKSTLLRMVAGLEQQTAGEITIGNAPVGGLGPSKRDIAMVFQNYALYPNMTVRDNMSFGLKMSTNLSGEDINEHVEKTSETMNISHLLDSRPGQLSGGEKQRVALGRAIVRDPNAFLMDEPLSNLDAKLRTEMRTEIKRLQRELDVTTIYVTHNQTEAMTMGDRLAILNDGELQQVGTPLECFYKPANTFVAGFIGSPSMNFFDVTREDDRVVGSGIDYGLPVDIADGLGDHTDLILGVRPEDLELLENTDSRSDFECVVDVVEPMGGDKYVYLTRAEMDTEETFIAEVDGQRRIESGDRRYAHIPENVFYLFERNTGEAVHHRKLQESTEQELVSKLNEEPTEAANT